jgi:iron complex outermembrane receptor protein
VLAGVCSLAGAFVLPAASAMAQSAPPAAAAPDHAPSVEVETIVVTAQKRSENIQTVPQSVSAVSGATLETQNIVTAQQLAEFVPGLQVLTANNVRDTTVSIRGIGSSGSNPGIETDVGIFLDGVYMPQGGVIQNELLDLNAVEVLRGPQGTLYGRNTSAGAININTRAPTQAFEAMADVQFGNYLDRRFSAYVGGGITDNLAARLSVFGDANDGYEKNLYDGAEVDDTQQYGARLRLLWTPTDDLKVNFIAYDTEMSSHCCLAVQMDPTGVGGIATPGFLAGLAKEGESFPTIDDSPNHDVDSSVLPDNQSQIAGGSIGVDWRLGGGQTLTSITAFNSFVNNIYAQPGADVPVDVAEGQQYLTTNTASEELRITSPSSSRLEYVAGVYGFYEREQYATTASLGPGANRLYPGPNQEQVGDGGTFGFDQVTYSASAFGQMTYKLTNWLRVLGGGRFDYDDKRAAFSSTDYPGDSAEYLALNPRTPAQVLSRSSGIGTWMGSVEADVAKDVMVYFRAASGYKDGGFNARAAVAGYPLEFGPETTTNFEVGMKSEFFDGKFLLNADIYDMFVNGFQQSVYASYLGTAAFVVGNAGNIRVQGLELEAKARPIEPLSISLNMDYNAGTFTDYPDGNCPTYPGAYLPVKVGPVCNYDGLTPSNMPRWTVTLTAEWAQDFAFKPDLGWFVGGDINYTSSEYLDPTLDPRSFQPSVTLVDAHLGILSHRGNWRVSLWGRNLTNVNYYSSVATLPQAANLSAGGTTAAQGFVGWPAPPRTFGVELNKKF